MANLFGTVMLGLLSHVDVCFYRVVAFILQLLMGFGVSYCLHTLLTVPVVRSFAFMFIRCQLFLCCSLNIANTNTSLRFPAHLYERLPQNTISLVCTRSVAIVFYAVLRFSTSCLPSGNSCSLKVLRGSEPYSGTLLSLILSA